MQSGSINLPIRFDANESKFVKKVEGAGPATRKLRQSSALANFTVYSGFVRHLENLEILEFLDFSFQGMGFLEKRRFFIGTWKNP